MLKYQREQEKIEKEEEERAEQRRKLAEAQERRANYMNYQKSKLQEYQVARALHVEKQALAEEQEMRRRAEHEAQRRAQEQYERKKALANWQAEKRKAEQMLLMSNNPAENPMQEKFEDEEYSVENEPQKQILFTSLFFEQNQNKEFAIEDDKSRKSQGDEGDDYSGDGYSGFGEGTSSAPAKQRTGDKKNLTSGNY